MNAASRRGSILARHRPAPFVAIAAVLFVSATACSMFTGDGSTGAAQGPLQATGIGLVSWGGNIYVIGGLDASGAYRSEVWRAAIGSDGSLGAWTRDLSLPVGLAFASCVAFGNMVYVIGGRSSSGLSSTVYFTMINSDGALGFTNGWATNIRPLPAARSGAAPVVREGRVFLIGGQMASGITSSIIDAGFWNDGELGQWYTASNPLPSAGSGYAAANFNGSFLVVGGGTAATYGASPDANGLPGAWARGTPPGGAPLYPALASTGDGLVMLGGYDPATGGFGQTWTYNGSAWRSSAAIEAYGPHCAVVASTLFVPATVQGSAAPIVKALVAVTKRAEAPRVSPGAGVIVNGASPVVVVYPGDTIRYTTASYGTTPADPTTGQVWSTASPPPITSPGGTYAFRAFRSGAEPSEIVYANYHTLSSSMFMLIQATLYPSSGATTYTPYSLTETYSGSQATVSSVWYQLIVSTRSTISLGWADATTDAAAYSAAISPSLFEDVGCSTPVQQADGSELYRLASGSANPATATLGPGTYYLLVESTNGSTGGSFGLLVGEGT
jgi:hypothetical protein